MARNYEDDGNLAGPYARDERHDGYSDEYAREERDKREADDQREEGDAPRPLDDVHIGKASE